MYLRGLLGGLEECEQCLDQTLSCDRHKISVHQLSLLNSLGAIWKEHTESQHRAQPWEFPQLL